jgi:ubiquinone biosynthesis protein COQ4
MRTLNRIQSIFALIGLIRDPLKTELVFKMANAGKKSDPAYTAKTDQIISSLPGVQNLYDQRYTPELPDINKLAAFPSNTFGHEFAEFIRKNNFDVGFFPREAGSSRIDFIVNRSRYSHDQWHVLTGFEATIPGEIGLQAFTLAQIFAPVSAVIIAAILLHVVLFKKSLFEESIESLFRGYEMGKRTKALFGIKLEDYWSMDLAMVRRELMIA